MKSAFFLGVRGVGLVAVGAASDSSSRPLTGAFVFTGKTIDPAPGQSRESHMLIDLSGEAAKALWEHMKVKPTEDLCENEGAKVKKLGDMQCSQSEDGKEYKRIFAIDFARQKIQGGWAC